ncbi:MAG: type II secretion system F family protein [Dehalococcoidia bacterium]|nr:MAG: type II secretion system F family protein [Dehalococcoidia bacterium]
MAFATSMVVFFSLVLFGAWYVRSKNQMEDRVRALSNQRRAMAEEDDPFTQRVMFPVIHGFSTRLLNYMPTSLISRAGKWLVISDSSMGLPTFMSIVLVLTTGLPALYFASIWASSSGSPSGRALAIVPLLALVGFLGPMMLLRRRAKNRQTAFWKALPDSLDLLTTCVEAGLSLDFAFQRVAERQRGPVGAEINRMLREKALGQTRKEALTAMAERIDLPDVNVFINSVIQAETLGTSIGQVLRIQSRQLRIRRRQRAEQVARQAAPKMVFPLVFFIMPNLFIVILGPIAINAYDVFRG